MEDLNAVIHKLNELFITVRYKYIKQNENSEYTTYNVYKKKNHKHLNDLFLKSHIVQENTYGIFCRKTHTKFITFDVDVPENDEAKKVVLALHEALKTIGIPATKIYTSWSGSKGYHVDIYFSEEIPYVIMEKLFNFAVLSTYNTLGGYINGKIEKRPSPTQGLKLPLSINYKNSDRNQNICWYVDVYNNFSPIRSVNFILSIEPIDAICITKLIKELPDENSEPVIATNPSNSILNINVLPNFDLKGETPNSLGLLYKNGLRKSGTRNASLCKLAIYFNTLSYSKKKCEETLIMWMANQDTNFYKTSLDICNREIKRIVNAVYAKNLTLSEGKNEIIVSRNELLTTFQYPKKLHNIINALLIHSKRFGNKDTFFYMTYKQLATAAGCSERTAINHINILEENNLLKVIRNRKKGLPENHPNTYKLNLNWLESEKNISILLKVSELESYSNIRTTLIMKCFPNNEWWNINEIVNQALKK